jgi:hypothetical protein
VWVESEDLVHARGGGGGRAWSLAAWMRKCSTRSLTLLIPASARRRTGAAAAAVGGARCRTFAATHRRKSLTQPVQLKK